MNYLRLKDFFITTSIIGMTLVASGCQPQESLTNSNMNKKTLSQDLEISTKELSKQNKKLNAENFVNRLTELGYYKYANSKDRIDLKQEWIRNFDPDKEIISLWDDETGIPKDYRYHFCDAERLYQIGGFIKQMDQLKPTFDKIGLKIDITGHTEKNDPKTGLLNHHIIINEKEYTLFKNFKEDGSGPRKIMQKLAEILNEALEKQNKEERVFLASGGSEGKLVFLTEEQFKYIDSIYKNDYYKPLQVEKWSKIMEQ